jgi:uncharacterized repeat protein (TIGR04138 family)
MSPDTLVDFDLRCVRCGYNLRGLTVMHRCPECEHPALRSYLAEVAGLPIKDRRGDRLLSARRSRIAIAELLGVSVESIVFVQSCIFHASRGIKDKRPKTHATAKMVCDAVRPIGVAHFGDEPRARKGMQTLKLSRSEDIGRIVAALVEAGLAEANEDDSPVDFAGQFTLESLFPTTEQA